MTRPGRDGGFTLVELLTVMGILAILLALVIGAAQGIRQHAARTETESTIAAIEAGLAKYFDDWGKFPWWRTPSGQNRAIMGEVRTRRSGEEGPTYAPLDSGDKDKGDPAAACLYAALAMDERNGPYYKGAGGNTKTFPLGRGQYFTVFVDGWGRPIHYFEPRPRKDGEESKFPLLMSEGPRKDIEEDPKTREDNIYNYEPETPPGPGDYTF